MVKKARKKKPSTISREELENLITLIIENNLFGIEQELNKIDDHQSLKEKIYQLTNTYQEKKINSPLNEIQLKRTEFILESAGIGTWDWWPKTNKVFFDSRCSEMFGPKHQQTTQDLSIWEKKIHPEDLFKVNQDIAAYLKGTTKNYENIHRVKHEKGHWVWVLDRGRITEYDEFGDPVRFTGIFLEVSSYKKLQQMSDEIQKIAHIGGWEVDASSVKVHWTSECYKIHEVEEGTPTDTFMAIDFYVGPDKEIIQKRVKECMEGKAYQETLQIKDAKGEYKWVETMGKPIFDSNGKVYKIYGTIQDVTERYNYQNYLQILARENMQYRFWIENASEGILNIGTDQKIFYVNYAFAKILGYEVSELLGRKLSEFIDIDQKKEVEEKFRFELLDKIDACEYCFNSKSKMPIWMNVSAFKYKEHDKSDIGIILMCSDITPIKMREYENQLLSQRLNTILNHTPIANYECCLDNNLTMNFIGPFIEVITGFKSEEFIENQIRTFESIIHPDDKLVVIESIFDGVQKGNGFCLKYRIIHKDQIVRWVENRGNYSKETGKLVGVILDITEKETYYNDLNNFFEQTTNLISIFNIDGYFSRVSSGFTNLLGYTTEEFFTKSFFDLIVTEDVEKTREELKKIQKGMPTIDFENRYKTKDGSVKILHWYIIPDTNTNLIYATARDLTEQKNLEHKNKQIFEALNKSWIVSETDSKGIITKVNENFCLISQYSENELIGVNHNVVSSGNHAKEFFKNMWKTLKTGHIWIGKIENRRKDGEQYIVNSVITPIREVVSGKIISYFSVRQDISDEVMNRRVLEEAELAGNFGSYRFNLKTEVASTWSKGYYRIFQFDQTTQPNFNHFRSTVHIEDRHIPILLIEDIMRRRIREFRIRYRIILKNDQIKHIEEMGKVLCDKNNHPEIIIGIAQDITERVLLNKKIETQRIQFVHTAKLASLGEMSAGIAHEINNPLAVILGNIQLLEKFKDQEEKFNSKIKSIEKSAYRIEKIVNGLKKFSRSSGSSGANHYKLENLKDIINESIDIAESKAKRNSVAIKINMENKLFINCDSLEIEQVIVNLINNAVDAVKELKEKWVMINGFRDKNEVVIQVIDSGNGISVELEEKLFQPFFTTKPVGDGTGLGLSISKGIVESHLASIKLNRNFSNTCFEMRFKLAFEQFVGGEFEHAA
jgi:PAS domain S-box-containing protein